MNIAPFLKKVPLFCGLSPVDLRMLSRIVRVREVKKGEVIFAASDPGDTLFVVVKGVVKIFGRSRLGKVKTFDYLETRDFFGEMALLQKAERSATAVASEPTILLIVRRKDFQALLKHRPQLASAMMGALCERLRRADREIESLTFNSVLGRVARALLDLAHRHGKVTPQGTSIGLDLSHRDLADMVGTARELVTRVLSRFERLGCVSSDGKSLVLLRPDKLKEWII